MNRGFVLVLGIKLLRQRKNVDLIGDMYYNASNHLQGG